MPIAKHLRSAGLGLAALLALAAPAAALEASATANVNVRSGPGTGFGVVDQLYAGEVVDVVECNAANTWCRIYHEGPDGWVSRSYLGAPVAGGGGGAQPQFGITIPLPGGGSITFGTPGYTPPSGGGAPPPPPPPATAQVCVYDLPNYLGASTCAPTGSSLKSIPGFWNNRVTSLRTFGGASIRMCDLINYGGFCNVFHNDQPMLGAGLNNKASSYDILPPEPHRVCVYDQANYQGASICANAGVSAPMIPAAWNDKISAVKVFGGAQIRLCQNPGFGGFCRVIVNNEPALGAALNNQASSYQTW